MMNNFSYVKAGSLAEAIKASSAKNARLHAGGTDLLGCLRDEVFQAEKIVSISNIRELKGISSRPDGSTRIGAMTTLAEIAVDSGIVAKYPVLAMAANSVGTPQIRQQGTIGGNLCQKLRCWYYRSDLRCFKKGGSTCYGYNGESQYHAILGGGPCFAVHPSDIAVALLALQAQVSIAGPSGNKTVKIESFFVKPDSVIDRETILLSGEILTGVQIPAVKGEVKSAYRKVRTRGSWDFAQAGVAIVLQLDNGVVRTARIALAGVAPYPWRAASAEKALEGRKIDTAVAVTAAEAAVDGASPLKDNAYKVKMVKGAVEETICQFIS